MTIYSTFRGVVTSTRALSNCCTLVTIREGTTEEGTPPTPVSPGKEVSFPVPQFAEPKVGTEVEIELRDPTPTV